MTPLHHRTAALRIVAQINSDYDRPANVADLSARGKMTVVHAERELRELHLAGLTHDVHGGVWLNEAGVAAASKETPTRVPSDALALNSEWTD
jgi:DeoR/GlpR family transcriptional regulator of sugar metabolism